jgi:voltage-gated potassium channel
MLSSGDRDRTAWRTGDEANPPAERSHFEPGSGAYQIFILGLSLYVLAALTVETLFHIGSETRQILARADTAACMLFLVDFIVSLARAPRRGHYFVRWGWIDLASSIPTVRVLRWGRFVRAVRIIRVLRGVRAGRELTRFVLGRRAEGVFLAVVSLALILVLFGAMAVLQFEAAAGGNIRTGEDAIWWAFSTVATVGSGSLFPVTLGGRVVAMVLMIAGVGLFGTFAGFVASWFLAPGERRQNVELDDLLGEMRELRRTMEMSRAHGEVDSRRDRPANESRSRWMKGRSEEQQ